MEPNSNSSSRVSTEDIPTVRNLLTIINREVLADNPHAIAFLMEAMKQARKETLEAKRSKTGQGSSRRGNIMKFSLSSMPMDKSALAFGLSESCRHGKDFRHCTILIPFYGILRLNLVTFN